MGVHDVSNRVLCVDREIEIAHLFVHILALLRDMLDPKPWAEWGHLVVKVLTEPSSICPI
jgi:hypothetical protein